MYGKRNLLTLRSTSLRLTGHGLSGCLSVYYDTNKKRETSWMNLTVTNALRNKKHQTCSVKTVTCLGFHSVSVHHDQLLPSVPLKHE